MDSTQTIVEKALQNISISELNKMQHSALINIKKEQNVILLAPTGSGKTLAFLLPVLEMLDPGYNGVQALVLSPSRELAIQIEQVFRSFGSGFKVNCCYGGHDIQVEKNNLSQPPALLVGTPGRIGDHLRAGRIDTGGITIMVIDEYDKCLEFGFKDELAYLIDNLPNLTRRVLTSATKATANYKTTGMVDPVTLNFLLKTPPKNLKVKMVETSSNNKLESLFRLVCKLGNRPTLIFCNQRDTVQQISDLLWEQDLGNNVFHGGLDQDLRERTLIKFRNGSHHILVTTDLAARGLDIPEIEYVIQYDMPENETVFTHRSGRTARMHASGTTFLMVDPAAPLPEFIKEKPEVEKIPSKYSMPAKTKWETLYIAAGRKEKISKADIVGLLLQKGQLNKDDLGLIDILDHASYVAVRREKIDKVLRLVANVPLKKLKVKIEVAR